MGCVYLVGAGPGDPDLLTVRALKLIREADVVVFDRLIGEEIQNLIPPGTTRFFAGKEPGRHPLAQEEINDLLLRLAHAGRKVVRLKGGDPFIFGRGGEEAEYLARHHVPFEVVPGISAASGCSAYAGIPLTHRGLATTVRFITGHGKDSADIDYDWRALVADDCTLVIYMGLGTLERIAACLMAAGMSPEMPAAAIENGTTTGQRQVIGSIADLPQRVTARRFRPPTLVIVGKVVALAGVIDWYRPVPQATGTAGQGAA
jgi:uroporphyrin-III C-methyltransferase/precorrin-2 dehydrogenase/sirohydrochlorin ferrochelatase/uroporphyrin-III C-methyltransferase